MDEVVAYVQMFYNNNNNKGMSINNVHFFNICAPSHSTSHFISFRRNPIPTLLRTPFLLRFALNFDEPDSPSFHGRSLWAAPQLYLHFYDPYSIFIHRMVYLYNYHHRVYQVFDPD